MPDSASQTKLLQSKLSDSPLSTLQLDPPGPPRIGKCAWCGAPLRGRAKETCSPDCRKAWDSFTRTLGIPLAKRLIIKSFERRGPSKRGSKALNEALRIGDKAESWLKKHWEKCQEDRDE